MAKSVSLFTIINGVAVNIGTCHPGQARILKKNGAAEWREGKFWLKIPVPEPKSESFWRPPSSRDKESIHQDGIEFVGPVSSVPDSVKADFQARKWFDEIDPTGVLRGKGRRDRKEQSFSKAEAFFTALKLRLDDEHLVWSCDDPKARKLGFIDDDTNEWLTLSMGALKASPYGDLAAIMEIDPEIFRDQLSTSHGRAQMVGTVEWTQHLEEILAGTEASDFLIALQSPTVSETMWDRGHKKETLDVLDSHFRRAKHHVRERKSIRANIQPPKGWSIFHWPRDRTRINMLDSEGNPTGPVGDPPSMGVYYRKGTKLARIHLLGNKLLMELGEMREIWEYLEEDGTEVKLNEPTHGAYVRSESLQVDNLDDAYNQATAWLGASDTCHKVNVG